jgi:hypothetical protein
MLILAGLQSLKNPMALWIQNYAYFACRRYYNEEPSKIEGARRTE